MGYREREGELAGLPMRVANRLRQRGLDTRAGVRRWYRREADRAGTLRGIGPVSVALIGTWLGEDTEAGGDDGG